MRILNDFTRSAAFEFGRRPILYGTLLAPVTSGVSLFLPAIAYFKEEQCASGTSKQCDMLAEMHGYDLAPKDVTLEQAFLAGCDTRRVRDTQTRRNINNLYKGYGL